MDRAVAVAWSVFGCFGAAYLAVAGVAAQLEEPQPWFAYWWQIWPLGISAVAGVVGLLLLIVWAVATLVRRVGAQRRFKLEAAVNKAFDQRTASTKPRATVSRPGTYSYKRGDLILNIRDSSLSFRWKNGVVAAKAIPEGQGYRVYDDQDNEIGYAEDHNQVVGLIDDHFPEVS